MKEILTKSGKIGLIEVPTNACNFKKDLTAGINNFVIKFSENRTILVPVLSDFKIIGKLSELTDKDCEEFVLKFGDDSWNDFTNYAILGYSDIIKVDVNGELSYRDYIDDMNNNYTLKPKGSFISLLKSEDIDTSKEYLIIKVDEYRKS